MRSIPIIFPVIINVVVSITIYNYYITT